MNYTRFNDKELQRFSTFLKEATNDNLSIEQVQHGIKNEVTRRYTVNERILDENKKARLLIKKIERANNKRKKCPKCDKGFLKHTTIVSKDERLFVESCVQFGKKGGCGYSGLVEDEV